MSTPAKTIAFQTVGCKLNFAETDTIARTFAERGYRTVPFDSPADVYVLNTCSVTANADRDCRKLIRKANRRNANAFIAVTGCYAQLKPDELAALPEVNAVFGSGEKLSLPDRIDALDPAITEVRSSAVETLTEFQSSFSLEHRTRAYLKIQDGCDYPCTYCTIPLARGKSRNAHIPDLIEQAHEIENAGMQEIVLTGVNVGDFGQTTGETLEELLVALTKETTISRIRISSIEPNLLTNSIIDLVVDSDQLVPHFHIPLQSGSDRILKAMKRRYLRDTFADRISTVRSRIPDAGLGADVIVGFPGETDTDFQDTVDFIESQELSYLHVFSYSNRENTPAAELPDPVQKEVKAERSRLLRNLSQRKRLQFQKTFLGSQRPVLFEYEKNGRWWGHTDNYILVAVPSGQPLHNRMLAVKLYDAEADFMTGELTKPL